MESHIVCNAVDNNTSVCVLFETPVRPASVTFSPNHRSAHEAQSVSQVSLCRSLERGATAVAAPTVTAKTKECSNDCVCRYQWNWKVFSVGSGVVAQIAAVTYSYENSFELTKYTQERCFPVIENKINIYICAPHCLTVHWKWKCENIWTSYSRIKRISNNNPS